MIKKGPIYIDLGSGFYRKCVLGVSSFDSEVFLREPSGLVLLLVQLEGLYRNFT